MNFIQDAIKEMSKMSRVVKGPPEKLPVTTMTCAKSFACCITSHNNNLNGL